MSDRDSRWIPARDALIAMGQSYANGMQADLAEALKISQVTILRYLSAGHWPARAGAYHFEKTTFDAEGKKVGDKFEKNWDPDSQAWVIPPTYWRALEASGANRNANWHLGEFDLPPYYDGKFTYSGFARNVEFDRAHLAQNHRDLTPTGTAGKSEPGRPGLGRTEYLAELERRIQAGTLESGVAEQSRVLRDWFCAQYPDKKAPKAVTIENGIRARYGEAKTLTK